MSENKISYTNKTSTTIFNDLVAAIPTLTSKWKNYSADDPGIVLVKMMAYLGDMLCYNMDYQVNETFPQTAIQRRHAQKSYDLIGYKMHWYRSATCELSITLTRPKNNTGLIEIIIPEFTTILTPTGIPYTIIGASNNNRYITLKEGEDSVTVDGIIAVQGAATVIPNIYKRNITDDGRIYIQGVQVDEDVANNPKFPHMRLALYDSTTNRVIDEDWVKVANLLDNTEDGKYYELRIDDNNQPYIQFNDGWDGYITNTQYFVLTYITSMGTEGKIFANVGFEFNNAIYDIDGNDMTPHLTIGNTQSNAGYNPETIEQAAISGPKEARTLGVAVTLEDYEILTKTVDNIRGCKAVDSNITPIDGYKNTSIPTSSTALENVTEFTLPISGYTVSPGTISLEVVQTDGTVVLSAKDNANNTIIAQTPTTVEGKVCGYIVYDSGKIQLDLSKVLNPIPANIGSIKVGYEVRYAPYSVVLYVVMNDYLEIPDVTRSQLETLFHNRGIATITQHYATATTQCIPFNISIYSYEPLTAIITNQEIKDSVYNTLYDYFNSPERDFGEMFRYPDLSVLVQNCSNKIQYSQITDPHKNIRLGDLIYPQLGPVCVNFSEDPGYQWLTQNIFDEDDLNNDKYDALIAQLFGVTAGEVDFSKILNENPNMNSITKPLKLPNSVLITIDGKPVTLGVSWWCSRPDIINVDADQADVWGTLTDNRMTDIPVTLFARISYENSLTGTEICVSKVPVNVTVLKSEV